MSMDDQCAKMHGIDFASDPRQDPVTNQDEFSWIMIRVELWEFKRQTIGENDVGMGNAGRSRQRAERNIRRTQLVLIENSCLLTSDHMKL